MKTLAQHAASLRTRAAALRSASVDMAADCLLTRFRDFNPHVAADLEAAAKDLRSTADRLDLMRRAAAEDAAKHTTK